jgi:hypothetical protein
MVSIKTADSETAALASPLSMVREGRYLGVAILRLAEMNR